MKREDVFESTSNYLKSEDLKGRRVAVTIRAVSTEEVGGKRKPILYFQGKEKGLVVNATNWDRLVHYTGKKDSDDWTGQGIVLGTEPTKDPSGRPCLGLRVQGLSRAVAEPVPEPEPEPTEEWASDDSVPF